ncbi:Histidine kinase [Rhodovastum atsumiense]|uniref:histidine kinase n=1 Tax=Rhodovastum atsumiense TaxID=504468 RepID=A0A5M6INV9_9PROT|nr:PAS domain-containing protein [Rhodovastum atsumiense]KAA5609155.1 PAS domain-containing protein [Rhodovastum atsumiense]CAH2601233.1 Histidine kinase [Rhodovastum atsumiense]
MCDNGVVSLAGEGCPLDIGRDLDKGRRTLNRSLLGGLLLCAVVALLPVLGFQLLNEWEARQVRERLVRDEAMRLASLVAVDQRRIVESARQLLTAIGTFPSTLLEPRDTCEARFTTLLGRFDHYQSGSFIGPDGRVVCATHAADRDTDVSDRAYFRDAMRTGGFAIGEMAAGRGTGQRSIHLAQAYRDEAGRIVGVIALGIRPDWLARQMERLPLPMGAAATVLDRNGTVIADWPQVGKFVGRPATGPVQALHQQGGAGLTEGPGPDGEWRIVAYTPTTNAPDGLGVTVGLSRHEAFRDLTQANQRGLALIALSTLLAMTLMVLVANRLVRRPAARLLAAVERLARGDLSARTELSAQGSEFERLGAAFDVMAERLQGRERALANALESTTDSVFALDRDWRFTYLNARAAAQLAAGRDLIGQDIRGVFPGLAGGPFNAAFAAAMARGEPAHADAPFAPLGRHFEAHAYPAPDGVTVFFRDVTEARAAEARLAESEEQFRTLAESIPQLAWMADGAGWVFWYNRRWYEYTGTTKPAMQGWGWRTRLHPDHADRVVRHITHCWATGEPWQDTFLLRGRDGRYRWFLSRALPIRNEAGEIVRWFGTNTDITEQREAETLLEARVAERSTQLVASERLFRAVFENTPDMAFVACRRADGRFVYEAANPAFAAFLDRPETEIVGRTVEDVSGPARARDMVERYTACIEQSRVLREETETEWHGEPRTLELVLVPLPDAATGTDRLVGSARDVTDRRELEQRLAQAQKLEAVGQLTGGIAHDFNNLLQVVAGNIELARPVIRRGEIERGARLLENARRAIGRGARLTAQLLAFSRRQTLHAERLVPSRLVAEMSDLFRRAAGETIRLETRAQPDLWPVCIDPSQLESALLNLVLNARDAMPRGGVLTVAMTNTTLTAREAGKLEDIAPGDYVRVEVSDTGEGMASEVLAHAFEPFFTTKEVGKGSGLGLAQVHGFVRQSGGAVAIVSIPGQGTSVSLFFPRAPAAPEETEGDKDSPARPPSATILLVEDDPDVLESISVLLADAGHRVIPARNGGEALGVLRSTERLDALVSDVVMPGGISGVDLAREARRLRPGLRVVLTSGYAADVLALLGAGAEFDVLVKPYAQADLLRRVAA